MNQACNSSAICPLSSVRTQSHDDPSSHRLKAIKVIPPTLWLSMTGRVMTVPWSADYIKALWKCIDIATVQLLKDRNLLYIETTLFDSDLSIFGWNQKFKGSSRQPEATLGFGRAKQKAVSSVVMWINGSGDWGVVWILLKIDMLRFKGEVRP